MNGSAYTTLFLDVGGVFLTNGWDHHMREHAAQKFRLDYAEMNSRHALTFDTYEIGKITLDEYLKRVVFYQPRDFSMEEFKEFMFAQSQPYSEMIQLIREIKSRYSLRTIAISNEGRELMVQRIKRFQLKEFIDFFVCSGFVGLRKPDEEIYRIALDMAQVDPKEVIYIDDRPMLAEIGNKLGMQAFHHMSFEQTQAFLQKILSVTPTGRTNHYARTSSDSVR
jgi:putative hydrolase of the HAD superfamily